MLDTREKIIIDMLGEMLADCPTIRTASHLTNGFLTHPPDDLSNPWWCYLDRIEPDNEMARLLDPLMPRICHKPNPAKKMDEATRNNVAKTWLAIEIETYGGAEWDESKIPWIAVITDKGYIRLIRDDFLPRLDFYEATKLWEKLSGESYWGDES
jgi:hypothetical protein